MISYFAFRECHGLSHDLRTLPVEDKDMRHNRQNAGVEKLWTRAIF